MKSRRCLESLRDEASDVRDALSGQESPADARSGKSALLAEYSHPEYIFPGVMVIFGRDTVPALPGSSLLWFARSAFS